MEAGMELSGSTVLVTGASSGIGAATARALADAGATVGIVARREARLAEVLADLRRHAPRSRMWVRDLADPDAAASFALEAWDAFGHIDVLVNNAGIPMRRHVTRLAPAELERVMAVNFFSPVRMTLALLPRMLERQAGTIVNVSSLGGRLGVATEAAYSASKFALAGFSEAMAADLAASPVRVRLVLPGAIDTEIWDRPDNDPPFYEGPKIPPEEVAAGILEAIRSDRFEHYVPDLRAVVEMKTKDFDAFLQGMLELGRSASPEQAPGWGQP
jgi:short-subunit dehydrogenase